MGDVLWTLGVWFFFYWLFAGIASVADFLWHIKEFHEYFLNSEANRYWQKVPWWAPTLACGFLMLAGFFYLPGRAFNVWRNRNQMEEPENDG